MGVTSSQVSVTGSQDAANPGILVTIQPGEDVAPGLILKPATGDWNLSRYGYVEAKVTNTGPQSISLCLCLYNAGEWQTNPLNAENIHLEPGKTSTIRVAFGYSFSKPSYPLKSSAVVRMLLFSGKADFRQAFVLQSIEAGGSPGEQPPSPQPAPAQAEQPQPGKTSETSTAGVDKNKKSAGGYLIGGDVPLTLPDQIEEKGATASVVTKDDQQLLHIAYPSGTSEESVTLKPLGDPWNLSEYLQLRFKLQNDGTTPVQPRIQVVSKDISSEWISAPAPLAPGASQELVYPFSTPVKSAGQPNDTIEIDSTAITAIHLSVEHPDAEKSLLVEAIQATLPPLQAKVAGLGEVPPVNGNWIKTMDENFDESTLDTSVWNAEGENPYDKQSHFSKGNIILGDGVVKLHYEKKTGHQNDVENAEISDYATGFLDTSGKWQQKYGYFEARMKLPRAPGLSIAFRLLSASDGQKPNGADTRATGMESDILEHLTGWGPFRYHVGTLNPSTGSASVVSGTDVYFQPDKDGFVTAGLLWLPNSAVFYCNGVEVPKGQSGIISNVPAFIRFTLTSGGYNNSKLDDAQLPADFVIDYVRAWQRGDLISPTDGKQRK